MATHVSLGNETPIKIKKLPLIELLKKIGPGIILTGVVIGPGNITTSAMLGANYGYDLLWLILPIMFMGVTFMMTSYQISMLTGMPIIHAIRHYYGKVAAAFVGVALFISCLFFTLGNITGTGAGMNLMFGMDWKLGSIIMLGVLLYCYFSKGVYSKVEKGIGICIIGMILAFYATLVATGGPEWGSVAHGVTHWALPENSLATALAYISTNAAVTAGIYATYLGVEKKWKKEDLFNGTMVADSIAHVVTVVLISGAIVLVGAIVLNPQHVAIKNPTQLADLLNPFLGNLASFVMGVALLGAGFSSLLGNTQRGMVLLSAGFDKEVGLESKIIRWGCVVCLVFASIICFSFNGSPTQLIFIANVATAIATPVAGFFVLLILWKKEIYQGYKVPRFLQISMTISYIFVLAITVSALSIYIPKLLNSLGL